MKTANSRNRAYLGITAVSAGVNVALLAACAPAMAHGLGAQHTANWGNAGAANSSFTPAQSVLPTPVLPQSFAATTAASVPVSTTPMPVHQLPQASFTPGHATFFHNNLVHPTASSSQTVNLDLTSASASVVLQPGVIGVNNSEVTISLGGVNTTYHTGDKVTAAELVAIYQMQTYGGQKISLDSQGRADGGSFSLNSVLAGTRSVQVSDVVVPHGVSAFDYLSVKSNISISGDLTNYGSIMNVSRGMDMSATLTANNILNAQTGVISSVGKTGSANVDLNLTAVHDFTNLGSIISSGGLSITAPNITNSGLLSSHSGNVNLSAPVDQNLNIINTGGTISALNGAINVRDAGYTGNAISNLTGGDLFSQQVNLHSGMGTVNVNVGELTGVVNSTGNAAHVQASTGVLTLGTQCLVGDPTYYNDKGDIVLNGDITVGETLAIVASGNITSKAATTKIVASAGGKGFDILMVAGANVTGNGTDTTSGVPTPGTKATADVSFTGNSSTGGNIDLSGADPNLLISTKSSNGTDAGGNVTLAAFSSAVFNGRVLLPANSIIEASATGGKAAGNVTVLAGAANGDALIVGAIRDSAALAPGASKIALLNYQPLVSDGPLLISKTGAITQGTLGADFSSAGGGDVTTLGILLGSDSVRIRAGGDVEMTNINQPSSATGTLLVTGTNIHSVNAVYAPGGISFIASGSLNLDAAMYYTNAAVKAGDILLVSGADYQEDASSVTISGRSSVPAAKITFGGGTIFANGINPGDNAGNINIIAFGGDSTSGQIEGNATIAAVGVGAKSVSGQVNMISGTTNGVGISGGSMAIIMSSAASDTGSVVLAGSTPAATSTNPVTIDISTMSLTGTFLGGAPAVGSDFVAPTVDLKGGNLTLIKGAAFNLNSSAFPFVTGSINRLTVYSGDNVNLNTDLSAKSSAILSDKNITLDTNAGLTTASGITLIAGGDITTKTGSNPIISTSDVGSTGAITIAAGAAFTLLQDTISITGASTTGGNIDFSNGGTGNIQTLSTISNTGDAGSISLIALAGSGGGAITLPGGVTVRSYGATSNGNFTAISGLKSGTGITVGDIDASGPTSTGVENTGTITLKTGTLSVSSGDPVVISTNGATPGIEGRFAEPDTKASIVAGNLTSRLGNIVVTSSQNVQLGLISVSGNGVNFGGSVDIFTLGTDNLEIGGTPTGTNFVGVIDASSANGLNGNVRLQNLDNSFLGGIGIKLNALDVIKVAGTEGGGSLTLITSGIEDDVIDLGPNATLLLNGGAGKASRGGGSFDIETYDVLINGKSGGLLTLSANGGDISGGGGSISVQLAKASPIVLNGANFQLIANGGLTEGTGGSVNFQSGGSLTYDPTSKAIDVRPGLANGGGGGTIELEAGYFQYKPVGSANANLLVTGPINVAAVGAKSVDGGSITLKSNSTVPFNIGLTKNNVNGVLGGLSVKSAPFGVNGSITVENNNGGVTNSVALTDVYSIDFIAGGLAGGIVVGAPLGNATTDLVRLTTNDFGLGSITQTSNKNIVTGNTVNLSAGVFSSGIIGGKTAFAVNTGILTVRSGGTSNITDSAKTVDLQGAQTLGGAFTLVGTATGGKVIVNDAVIAGSNITITAANIDVNSVIQILGPTGKVLMTATTGDVQTPGAPGISDISAAGGVTVNAAKGEVLLDSVGGNYTSTISVTALTDLTATNLQADTSVIAKAGGNIIILDTAGAQANSGVTTFTSTGGDIDTSSAFVVGGKSVTYTASKGNVGYGLIVSDGAIAITAGKDVFGTQIAGLTSITIKAGGNIAMLGDTDLSGLFNNQPSATVGTITLTAANGVIFSDTGTLIAGGKTITMSAPKGSIQVSAVGAGVTGSISLSASDLVSADDDIVALNSVSLKTTSTATGKGGIVAQTLIAFAPAAGVVSVSASGDVALNDVVSGTKSVTISAKGAITTQELGLETLPAAAISVTAGKSIAVSAPITALNSVSLKTTAAGATGDISLQTVSATSNTGTILVSAAGSGATIRLDKSSDASAGKSVTLTAAKGSLSSISAGMTGLTNAISLTAGTNIQARTLQANNSVTISQTDKNSANGINLGTASVSAPTGTITLTAAGGGDITADDLSGGTTVKVTNTKSAVYLNGVGFYAAPTNLTVTAQTKLQTNGAINVGTKISLLTKSTAGTDGIDINRDMKTNAGAISIISAGGFLNVADGVTMVANSASTKSKATILLENSNKTAGAINIGVANIATSGVGGSDINIAIGAPAKGINPNPAGTPAGVTVNPTPGFFAYFGPAKVVTSPSPTTINLVNANVIFSAPTTAVGKITLDGPTITADPPTAPSMVRVSGLADTLVNTGAIAAQVVTPVASISAPAIMTSNDMKQVLPALTASYADLQANRTLQGSFERLASRWISETEIDGGEIPVALHGDGKYAIIGTHTAGISGNTLSRGTVLSMPTTDTTINTRHGDVSVAAGSMVVVMALEHGLAVYNLDDTKTAAVVVRAGGGNMVVRPGTSLVITSQDARSFAHVNPAQLVCYRRITEQQLGGGLKAFRAEYSIGSAVHAIKPLKALIVSEHKETSKVARHFLKTLSILMQLQSGGEDFKQVLKPQLTASAR